MKPIIIRMALGLFDSKKARVKILAERTTLAKRRWMGVAENGAEFGFDLQSPMTDGAVIYEDDQSYYVLIQEAEQVLEIALGDPMQAARLGWSLGNLHFPVQVDGAVLRVVDDSAVRLYLERDHISYSACHAVFRPIKATSSHGHAH